MERVGSILILCSAFFQLQFGANTVSAVPFLSWLQPQVHARSYQPQPKPVTYLLPPRANHLGEPLTFRDRYIPYQRSLPQHRSVPLRRRTLHDREERTTSTQSQPRSYSTHSRALFNAVTSPVDKLSDWSNSTRRQPTASQQNSTSTTTSVATIVEPQTTSVSSTTPLVNDSESDFSGAALFPRQSRPRVTTLMHEMLRNPATAPAMDAIGRLILQLAKRGWIKFSNVDDPHAMRAVRQFGLEAALM